MYQVENIPSAYFQKDVNLRMRTARSFPMNVLTFTELIIIGHVSEIFLIAMADQNTHTYSHFLRLFCLWVMSMLSLKGDFWLINIFQYPEIKILLMRRPL